MNNAAFAAIRSFLKETSAVIKLGDCNDSTPRGEKQKIATLVVAPLPEKSNILSDRENLKN